MARMACRHESCTKQRTFGAVGTNTAEYCEPARQGRHGERAAQGLRPRGLRQAAVVRHPGDDNAEVLRTARRAGDDERAQPEVPAPGLREGADVRCARQPEAAVLLAPRRGRDGQREEEPGLPSPAVL